MKSKTTLMAAIAATALLGGITQSQAAVITWGTATTVAATTDVVTTGTLLYAERFGGTATLIINGVSFAQAGTNVTGFGGEQQTGIGSPSGITGDYATFLDGDYYGNVTLTLTGLTLSQQYLVQFWSNDARGGAANQLVTYTAGNSVDLNRNVGGTGFGQWVTGTFTADAITQDIAIGSGVLGNALNGLQVRTIPEPSAALLGGLGLLALLRRRRG